jgi:hypothetical protein
MYGRGKPCRSCGRRHRWTGHGPAAPRTADARALPTSYALQSGYGGLIRSAGTATAQDIDRLHARLTLAGDARDLFAARDSLRRLLGLPPLGS